jgi:hypothetical protein
LRFLPPRPKNEPDPDVRSDQIMEKLQRQVARARRRLILGQFFAALAWCWTAALAVSAIGLAVAKLFPLNVDGRIWTIAWIGGALAAGTVATAIWTWIGRRDPLFAAIEIDRRFGLKERVSSVLALSQKELDTEAGQALLSDAVRRVERVDIPGRFAVPISKRNFLPLAPALVVFGLTFLADKGRPTEAVVNVTPQAAAQVHDSAEVLRRKLAQQRKEATEKGLQDAGDLFKKIEEGIKDLASKQGVDRKQALVQLNDLAKQLESRKKELGGDDKLKQELNQMKDMKNGPAEKLADTLKNGKFQKALNELQKLEDELKADKLDPKDQAQMAKQLETMKQALDKMTEKHEQVQQDLKKQIEQMKSSGQTADAKRLQKQLDQLQQQAPQMDQLKQMAQQLGQVAKSMKEGKQGEAGKALDKMAKQIQSLKRQADEQQMIDQALDEVAECRSSMTCDKPGDAKDGDGKDRDGNGGGDGFKQGSDNDKLAGEVGGGGPGRASGHRPEKATGVKFYDSKVAQKTGQGAAVITGEADGPNLKGKVRAQIQAEMDSAKHEDSDPLTGQRLPRSQRDFAKEYFDSLRDGE